MALPRVHGSLVRTAAGDGPSRVAVTAHGPIQTATLELGYPMMGEVDIADDSVVFALVLGIRNSARWDGIDLRPGQVFVYPSHGLHQATDSAGMTVGMITAPMTAVQATADQLGRPLDRVEQRVLDGRAAKLLLAVHRQADRRADGDNIMRSLVASLTAGTARPGRSRRASASRAITSSVLGYLADSDEWLPSMVTVCRIASVSERRVETAFHDVYGIAPTVFLRHRALSEARLRLLSAMPGETRVGTIAHDLGFHHLGRFAQQYRDAFGTLPSDTLGTRA